MENGLAQGIGGIAFMVGVMAFWQKDDLRFRYQMMAFCFIMGVHFVLLGATVAAIGVVINGIRSFASIKTQSRKVMWFFIAMMWLMTLPNMSHFLNSSPCLVPPLPLGHCFPNKASPCAA